MTFTYSGRQSTSWILPSTHIADFTYDDRFRVASVAEWVTSNGATTQHSAVTSTNYGPFGTVARVLDAKLNPRTFVYDSRGRTSSIQDPDANATLWNYDGFGRVTNHQTYGGNTSYQYDAAGLLLGSLGTDGQVCMSYGRAGHANSRINAPTSGTTVTEGWSYDGFGRIVDSTQTVAAGTGDLLDTKRSYDSFGRLATITPPTVLGAAYVIKYGYDSYGNVASATTSDGSIAWSRSGIDDQNQYESEAYGAVTAARTVDLGTQRPSTIGYSVGTKSISNVAIGYDPLGRLSSRIGNINGTSLVDKFGYDELNRVTSWADASSAAAWVHPYSYDDLGNFETDYPTPTASTPNASTAAFPFVTIVPGASPPGGVQSVISPGNGWLAYKYDNAGRVVSIGTTAISWTSFNKPLSITSAAGTRTYAYDGGNNRVFENDSSGFGMATRIDGIYVRRTNGLVTQEHIISVPGPSGVVGEIHLSQTPSGVQKTVRYNLPDQSGSPLLVVDGTGAVIGDPHVYDPFGRRMNLADPRQPYTGGDNATEDTLGASVAGFEGHRLADASGLIDMGGRMFDTASHRFLSPDPNMGSPTKGQSLNRYSWVHNRGWNATDPTGYCDDGSGSGNAGDSACSTSGNFIIGAALAIGAGGYWLGKQVPWGKAWGGIESGAGDLWSYLKDGASYSANLLESVGKSLISIFGGLLGGSGSSGPTPYANSTTPTATGGVSGVPGSPGVWWGTDIPTDGSAPRGDGVGPSGGSIFQLAAVGATGPFPDPCEVTDCSGVPKVIESHTSYVNFSWPCILMSVAAVGQCTSNVLDVLEPEKALLNPKAWKVWTEFYKCGGAILTAGGACTYGPLPDSPLMTPVSPVPGGGPPVSPTPGGAPELLNPEDEPELLNPEDEPELLGGS
jgi:RHS repeat-associated protein